MHTHSHTHTWHTYLESLTKWRTKTGVTLLSLTVAPFPCSGFYVTLTFPNARGILRGHKNNNGMEQAGAVSRIRWKTKLASER